LLLTKAYSKILTYFGNNDNNSKQSSAKSFYLMINTRMKYEDKKIDLDKGVKDLIEILKIYSWYLCVASKNVSDNSKFSTQRNLISK